MCGILGAFGAALPERETFQKALNTLARRGPDGEGIFATPTCLLGHRRLAIIDLATGAQPMTSFDGRFTITFNGEIYNYRELKKELEGGYPFSTNSDTEVILAGYRAWGRGILDRLEGMFAFAILDTEKQELFCARDPFGIKPLVYGVRGNTFFFASEIKALRALGVFDGGIDEARIPEFFALKHIPAPHTIYQGIKKLPAGHFLCSRFSGTALTIEEPVQYWSPNSSFRAEPREAGRSREISSMRSFDSPDFVGVAQDDVRSWLLDSVKAHLVSDVPVGAFLSGGLDSSSIVWAMSQFTRPKTFTVGFKEMPDDPDLLHARLVAEHFNTEHTEILLDLDLRNTFSNVMRYFDEPFADPATVMNWYVAQATSGQVKVALSGDGGDELFFGYDAYAAIGAAATMRRLLPWFDARSFIVQRYFGYDPRVQKRVVRGAKTITQPFVGWEVAWRGLKEAVRQMDLMYTLPEYYLRKVDGVSMMNSLEVRVPMVSRAFAAHILPLPAALHYDKNVGKALLRKAMTGVLPEPVLTRKKQGFTRPWKTLFAGSMRDMVRERLLSQDMARSGWFSMDHIGLMLRDQEEGRRDYANMLFRLLVFSEWLDTQTV